jgi:hypothetical protein
MRITIIKRPYCTINEIEFKAWRVGETYDVSPSIASFLIVHGCARLEMRSGLDRRHARRVAHAERRHEQAHGRRW